MLTILKGIDAKFTYYGNHEEEVSGNIQLKKFSNEDFIKDLSSCRAVLANGGFTLMGEALYLGKPFFAVPMQKQFEQIMNALYLKKLGYGDFHKFMDSETLKRFIDRLDKCSKNLEGFIQDGNKLLFNNLDQMLENIKKRKKSKFTILTNSIKTTIKV